MIGVPAQGRHEDWGYGTADRIGIEVLRCGSMSSNVGGRPHRGLDPRSPAVRGDVPARGSGASCVYGRGAGSRPA